MSSYWAVLAQFTECHLELQLELSLEKTNNVIIINVYYTTYITYSEYFHVQFHLTAQNTKNPQTPKISNPGRLLAPFPAIKSKSKLILISIFLLTYPIPLH